MPEKKGTAGLLFETRAMPVFDSLLDAERQAVVEAVARFEALPKSAQAQWPERCDPYLVVPAGDLFVLLSEDRQKPLIVVDIVRKAALGQFAAADSTDNA